MSYCDFAVSLPEGNVHKDYHQNHYGFPVKSDQALFERLVLEINQAGLSWTTILNKQAHFRKAYSGFDVDLVAAYKEEDEQRLLSDPGIIRNRLKIKAAIFNAEKIVRLREEYGSFRAWLDAHHPLEKKDWVRLFKKNFRFTGGEIVGEFLISLGYLPGAHHPNCPVYPDWVKSQPPCLG